MHKILVIEDEKSLLEDLIAILQYADYDAEGEGGGAEGVEHALAWKPDLILCDVMMPGVDGFEALRRIRGEPSISGTPFIFLTARGDRASQRQGMDLGADDYLVKPFTATELLSAVEARLKRFIEVTDTSLQSQLEATKQQLARMVTHELRTPLISINTVLEIITRQVRNLSPDEIAEMLDTIGAGSKRLTHRVEQLVYLTQLEAGTLTYDVIQKDGVCTRLWEILVAATNLARRFAYNQPANVITDMQDRNPEATVLCNPPALKQALAEVLSNALKFSPEDGTVQVNQWSDKDSVYVSIVDQGDGIPESQVALALRAFEQIDRDRQEQQGIGMGLSLANQIIKVHGGTLDISTVIGRGTRVNIRLPLIECE
ncbi:MAG: response regulator [Anaerolineae bacterium]